MALNKLNLSAILTAYFDGVQFNAVTPSTFQFFQVAIFQESFSQIILYKFIVIASIDANLRTSFFLDPIVILVTQLSNNLIYVLPK
jgi:hypothetical protein